MTPVEEKNEKKQKARRILRMSAWDLNTGLESVISLKDHAIYMKDAILKENEESFHYNITVVEVSQKEIKLIIKKA